MRRLTVTATDGVDIAAQVHSEHGPPVVLVHGYPDSSELWRDVLPLLTADHQVVTYDVRGAGGSGQPTGRRGYRFAQLAEDLVSVIDAAGIDEPVHLVGHDWGAIQSFEAACRPEHAVRLRSFTCISGASFDLAGRELQAALRPFGGRGPLGGLGQIAHSWYILLFQLPRAADLVADTVPISALAGRIDRVDLRAMRRSTSIRDGRNGIELYRANFHRVLRPRTREVLVPLHVLHGEDDPFLRPWLFDRIERYATAGVTHEVVAGGHWLPVTRPSLVAERIRDVVAANSAPTPVTEQVRS